MKQKTKLEIINETASFYNSENRSLTNGNCLYNSEDGKQCAFQRCVETNLTELGLEGRGVSDKEIETRIKEGVIKFKDGYGGHPVEFWKDIQLLHDCENLWNKSGLSVDGQKRANELIEKYK